MVRQTYTSEQTARRLKPVIEMLPGKQADQSGIVVDLRKLPFRDIAIPAQWRNLVSGYDLLAMLPEFTPANLYG